MKLFILPLLLFALSSAAQDMSSLTAAQNLENLGLMNNPGTVITYNTLYSGVKGSPFYDESWRKGDLFLSKGDTLRNLLLKLDQYKSELILQRRPSDIYIPREMISGFVLRDGITSTYFEELILEEKGPTQFAELLVRSNMSRLYLIEDVQFLKADLEGAYKTGRTSDEFVRTRKFYCKIGSQKITKVPKSRRKLSKLFVGKEAEMKAFMKRDLSDLSNQEDLMSIFQYHASLE